MGKLFGKRDCCGHAAPGALRGAAWAGGVRPVPARPRLRTVSRAEVTEYVPTMVDQTVTVMQQQTADRRRTPPTGRSASRETVTKQVTVNKQVTETVNEYRVRHRAGSGSEASDVMERVPVQKQVTVMERVPSRSTVTVMERVPVQKQVTVMERVPSRSRSP